MAGIPVIDNTSIIKIGLMIEKMQKQYNNAHGARGLAELIDSVYDLTVEVNADRILEDAGIRSAEEHGIEDSNTARLYDNRTEVLPYGLVNPRSQSNRHKTGMQNCLNWSPK